MAKKIKEFVCGCGLKFKTSRGLSQHKSKADHWIYPKPTDDIKRHRNYIDFFAFTPEGWGRNMTNKEFKSPSIEELQTGALIKIISLLNDLIKEVRKKKIN